MLTGAQPSVEAALTSPKTTSSEPRKSTIGQRKPAAKKGVNKLVLHVLVLGVCIW